MNLYKLTLQITVILLVAAFSSCKKDDNSTTNAGYSNGIFIVNEGVFTNGTGTITYYNPDSNLLKQDIFASVNGRPLGNVAQSMTVFNGKGYIVVNNAGKVEVVETKTFKSIATISNLKNPSQFLVIDANKAYVSDWIGHVAVIDLKTNSITRTITTGTGPDAMLKSGNYVYVANSGGLSVDSTVTVIDYTTDQAVKTIHVGDAPEGMADDGNGHIWVLCKGKGFTGWPQAGDTEGRLTRINTLTNEVDLTFVFPLSTDHPDKPVFDKQHLMLYYLFNNSIYRFNLALGHPVPEPVITNRGFYSLGYENKTGYLYATDARDYISNGVVIRYKATDGTVVDSIQAGIIPRAFAFPE